jgi:hypothetical protein
MEHNSDTIESILFRENVALRKHRLTSDRTKSFCKHPESSEGITQSDLIPGVYEGIIIIIIQ